eukprot:gene1703-33108_t
MSSVSSSRAILEKFNAGKELLKALDLFENAVVSGAAIVAGAKLVSEASGKPVSAAGLEPAPGDSDQASILDNIHKDTKQKTTATSELSVESKDGSVFKGFAAVVLCQLFGKLAADAGVESPRFLSPDASVYQSAKDLGAIEATVKVNSGYLFPLPSALLFIERPPMFIPTSDVRCYEFARAGGTSVTFDLILHMKSVDGRGEIVEFSQLDRAELGRLHSYLEKSKMKKEEEGGEEEAGSDDGEDGGDDSDEDSEDDDFDPEAPECEDDGRAARRPSKRLKTDAGGSGGGAASGKLEDGDDEEEEEEEDEGDGGGSEEDEESSDESYDSGDSDVELEDEEGISAGHLRSLMSADKLWLSNSSR